MSETDIPDIHLRVLYDFQYKDKANRDICIKSGEKLFLIKRTNNDWWHVIRNSTERPFYVPATYVEEIRRVRSIGSTRRSSGLGENLPPTIDNKNTSNVHNENIDKYNGCKDEKTSMDDHCYKPRPRQRQISEGRQEKKIPESPSEEVRKLLLDKRKSWAVEELVSELSAMRGLRVEPDYINLPNCDQDSNHVITTNSNCKPIAQSSSEETEECIETKHLGICESKHSLSSESDKKDLLPVVLSSMNSASSVGELDRGKSSSYSKVSLSRTLSRDKEASRSDHQVGGTKVIQLSDSLEKLAQQIQFGSGNLKKSPQQSPRDQVSDEFCEDILKTPTEKMLNKVKNKLSYSRSFKTKRELQKFSRPAGAGNSVLSSSWEQKLNIFGGNEWDVKARKEVKANGSISENKPCKTETGESNRLEEARSERVSWGGNDNQPDPPAVLFHKPSEPVMYKVPLAFENHVYCSTNNVSNSSDDVLKSSDSLDSVDRLTSDPSRCEASDEGLSDDLSYRDTGAPQHESRATRKRRTSLTRGNRVELCRLRHSNVPLRPQSPPSPAPDHVPSRFLHEGWAEYSASDGRNYYYNSRSGDKSWKPPRKYRTQRDRTEDGSTDSVRSTSSSPLASPEETTRPSYVPLPNGWRVDLDDEGQPYYVNETTSAKWFSSLDDEGRVYFFEENSNESSWTLPRVDVATSESPATGASPDIPDVPTLRVQTESVEIRKRGGKSQSMIIGDSKQKDGSTKSSSMPRNKPDFDGNIGIVREGPLNRTKLLENGKKLRKNWASNHVVLTERSLLFFKDAKTLASAKASPTLAGPEFRIELPGAALLHDEKVSSRKNVFLVSSALGLEVLLQCDNNQLADEWFTSLQATIARQPAIPETGLARSSSRNTQLMLGADSPDETKKGLRIGRTKSVKVKHKEGSLEDLGSTPDERQVKIKARLKKFFNRRPTREVLVKKGIYKDEPVFGCLLVDAVGSEIPRVPYFVRRCVEAIESKPENMKMDGLYRASGNLSQVQKIRLQVDQNNLSVLETEDDVHVLAGAFKLFFRELKQPLIPFEFFQRALAASTNPNKRDKNHEFRSIIKALPGPNRDTLDFLLQHLLKVTKWQEYNRMDISNLAIVFGPTLMWPESESPNMAFFLMQQNLVIEYLLLEFVTIFR